MQVENGLVGASFKQDVLKLAILVCQSKYSKVSIIRPGRSRLLEFEKKIALVV